MTISQAGITMLKISFFLEAGSTLRMFATQEELNCALWKDIKKCYSEQYLTTLSDGGTARLETCCSGNRVNSHIYCSNLRCQTLNRCEVMTTD